MKIVHTEDYKKLRADAYPPMSDLADALYWQSKGDDTKMNEYIANCEAIKIRYKKLAE
jgi:hypothetical protein